MSDLEAGFHTIHYQVVSSLGQVSPARTSSFYRIPALEERFKDYAVTSVRYWFDMDQSVREDAYANGAATFDVSDLETGFHTLHYQVVSSLGEVSPARTSSFYRIPALEEHFKDYAVTSVRYWFDMDQSVREAAYANGAATFDVSDLEAGFHTIHYQVVSSLGEVSPARTSSFYRIPALEEHFKDYAVTSVRYWFDNDISTMQTVAYDSESGTLDLSRLAEGAHTLNYQVISSDGQLSPARSAAIDRWLYDIYVSKTEQYSSQSVSEDPLFASKPDLKLHYLPTDLGVRGHLTVDDDVTLSLGKYVHTVNLGSQTANRFTKTGLDYYHPTTLVNKGFVRADSVIVKMSLSRDRWHFITLPFNANVNDIDVPGDTYWALRRYDGEARAAGMMADTWDDVMPGERIEAGKGYILQHTMEGQGQTSLLTFKAINDTRKNDIFTTRDVTLPLEEHQAEFAHNRSWNLVGNPYPCFFDSRYIGHNGTIIVWNGNGYQAYSLLDDKYVLMPFEAFFVQRPVNSADLTFNREGRQDTHEARSLAEARTIIGTGIVPARRILNFALSDGTDTDVSRVVVNERSSTGYESDRDAPKFMEEVPQSPQLFSIDSGVRYAINERPQGNGVVTFSIYAPVAGEYRFSLSGDAGEATVLDTGTGIVWPMSQGDYVFEARAGMDNARLVVSLAGNVTSVSQVEAFGDGEIKAVDGRIEFSFGRAKSISVFGTDGRKHYSGTVSDGTVILPSGIYIVNVDGTSAKIVIK